MLTPIAHMLKSTLMAFPLQHRTSGIHYQTALLWYWTPQAAILPKANGRKHMQSLLLSPPMPVGYIPSLPPLLLSPPHSGAVLEIWIHHRIIFPLPHSYMHSMPFADWRTIRIVLFFSLSVNQSSCLPPVNTVKPLGRITPIMTPL